VSEGELDEPLARQAAGLCRKAGAGEAAIAAWIERVIDGWRSTRQMVPAESLPEEGVFLSAEDIVLSKIAVERCLKVIGSMEQRPKRVAYLKWHEGWTNTEIAKHFGIDRATMLRDLRSVVAAMKEQVGDEIPFL
jgi:DNA-directed RNA polymerase specialized sigma24 family protein